MDDNIDTNNNNNNHNNTSLLNIMNDHLVTNNIVRLNSENTRFIQNQNPSSIDHIYTNSPNNVTNVRTYNDMISDHKIIGATYNYKEKIYFPQFINTRNRRKLTRENL